MKPAIAEGRDFVCLACGARIPGPLFDWPAHCDVASMPAEAACALCEGTQEVEVDYTHRAECPDCVGAR